MNRDQIRGASRHIKGRAQTALGGLTGDPARQVRGAVNQVTGGAQYAYGRARDRAEDLVEDGRHLAHEARERADHLIDDGRHYADEARRRVSSHGRRAIRYADTNRTTTLLAFVGVAFALGWLARPSR
ncbi:CsbD family protein [Methylobacterium sp. SI9]|uniref:CsbD family protein n=1 Tax=Methylobacterium guangdongense TaxID=3138811 RepID=UPI00313E84C7